MNVPTRDQLVEIVKRVFKEHGQRYDHKRADKALGEIIFSKFDSELNKFQKCLVDAGVECWCECPGVMIYHDEHGVLIGTWENIKEKRKFLFQKEYEDQVVNVYRDNPLPKFLKNVDFYADCFCRHRARALLPVRRSCMILLVNCVMDSKEQYCGPPDRPLLEPIRATNCEMVS